MTSVIADGAHAVSIKGDFDDCQALVKALFNDLEFRDEVNLSAVNSINWARLMPQIVYYFSSALALGAPDRKVAFRCQRVTLVMCLPVMPQRKWDCQLNV